MPDHTAAFIDPFGSGFLQDNIKTIKDFYNKNQLGVWRFTEWTRRLQTRGDTWNCGIWAIWIQIEELESFEAWFQDNITTILAGQDLREHYHAVMQVANRAVPNSETGFAISRSIAASR